MGTISTTTGELRPWTDLPTEILLSIAVRLPLLDLLTFRATCKDFRSASATATAAPQPSKKPWLIIHNTTTSKCTIHNPSDSKTYHRNIPDLAGAICLASYQGWLLLSNNQSIFFFSPFSLSKIPLPNLPQSTQISDHVAAFSDKPTSPNCIVSIIHPIESFFEINVISKGQKNWTQHKIPQNYSNPTVSAATFDQESQTFYYMYGKNCVATFSVQDEKWHPYRIVPEREKNENTKVLPYVYHENAFKVVNLEDGECVDRVCGLTYEPESCDRKVYLNEDINVADSKRQLCKAVWIQPRFYEARKDLQW